MHVVYSLYIVTTSYPQGVGPGRQFSRFPKHNTMVEPSLSGMQYLCFPATHWEGFCAAAGPSEMHDSTTLSRVRRLGATGHGVCFGLQAAAKFICRWYSSNMYWCLCILSTQNILSGLNFIGSSLYYLFEFGLVTKFLQNHVHRRTHPAATS